VTSREKNPGPKENHFKAFEGCGRGKIVAKGILKGKKKIGRGEVGRSRGANWSRGYQEGKGLPKKVLGKKPSENRGGKTKVMSEDGQRRYPS